MHCCRTESNSRVFPYIRLIHVVGRSLHFFISVTLSVGLRGFQFLTYFFSHTSLFRWIIYGINTNSSWNLSRTHLRSRNGAQFIPYYQQYQQCSKLSSSHHLPPPRWHSAPPWWLAHHSPRCPCLLRALPDRPHHLDSSILWAWVLARLSVKSRWESYHSSTRLDY